MLFQSLRALCLAPGGAGSIWNHLGALVRSTRLSGRFACGFRTDLYFADGEVWTEKREMGDEDENDMEMRNQEYDLPDWVLKTLY